MIDFRQRYLDARRDQELSILDVGSYDVNGTFRPVFAAPTWQYRGLDISAGPNVDIVAPDPYDWSKEVPSNSVDVVISGSAFEHIEFFWLTTQEIGRVLKPGGLFCLIVPSAGPEHRYPVDCWRFYRDGLVAIAKYAGLESLEAQTHRVNTGDPGDVFCDSVLVARKNDRIDPSK